MHCNSQLFCHFSQAESQQNDQVCLVLTKFPQKTDLSQTKILIQEEFPFVNRVKVRNDSEIQCYFDSMTDLIELDQGRRYGAGKAFIKNIDKQAQVCSPQDSIQKPNHGVFPHSSQTFESQTVGLLPSYKYIPSVKDTSLQQQPLDPRLLHHPRKQRLTSLEDEIEELENLREELGLFKDEIDGENTGVTEVGGANGREDQKGKQADQNYCRKDRGLVGKEEHLSCEESDKEKKEKPTGKQMMFSLLQGAALTGILIGGLKLFKTFIK